MPQRLVIFLLCVGPFVALLAHGAPAAELTIQGDMFRLNGEPFDMWGIRTASASQSRELTDRLIAALDDYAAHGVNTISVYYMGSSGGYSDPFSADGRHIDPGHQRRMEKIIRACDQRGMVVVVGIFYQRCDAPRLENWDACREAVRTVAGALRPHENIIINIANEQNSRRYEAMRWSRVNEVDELLDLCRIVKQSDPDRIVGAGGYDHDKNDRIGRSEDVDVLLFDTNGPEPDSGALYDRFRAAGVWNKPLVNVETFGGWTKQFMPQGVFSDRAREAYLREMHAAARQRGLYVHFHNNPWCQPSVEGDRIRYDLGGPGTVQAPGIRWYFEAVREVRRRSDSRSAAHDSPKDS